MAVYNGGIRFAPDVYYEIKENGEEITVLRNGEEIGGGSGNVFIVNAAFNDDGELALDKTWQEIYDAFSNNTQVSIKYVYYRGTSEYCTEILNVAKVEAFNGAYYVNTCVTINRMGTMYGYPYVTDNPDAYPVCVD